MYKVIKQLIWIGSVVLLGVAARSLGENHCGYPEQQELSPRMTPGMTFYWEIHMALPPVPPLEEWDYWVTGPRPLDRDAVVCCTTPSGYTIVVAPPEACTTVGEVCEFATGASRLYTAFPVAWDTDCDGDIDLLDFAALTRGGE